MPRGQRPNPDNITDAEYRLLRVLVAARTSPTAASFNPTVVHGYHKELTEFTRALEEYKAVDQRLIDATRPRVIGPWTKTPIQIIPPDEIMRQKLEVLEPVKAAFKPLRDKLIAIPAYARPFPNSQNDYVAHELTDAMVMELSAALTPSRPFP